LPRHDRHIAGRKRCRRVADENVAGDNVCDPCICNRPDIFLEPVVGDCVITGQTIKVDALLTIFKAGIVGDGRGVTRGEKDTVRIPRTVVPGESIVVRGPEVDAGITVTRAVVSGERVVVRKTEQDAVTAPGAIVSGESVVVRMIDENPTSRV